MTLSETIRDALSVQSLASSQQQVQDAVASRLVSLTPGASARRTGYFNHSWAPDIVVRSTDGAPERKVFLRFDVSQPEFELDLNYLSDENPMFVGLISEMSDVRDASPHSGFNLGRALEHEARKTVLVTETSSLDVFDTGVTTVKGLTAATGRVVTGGRGWIDSNAASEITSQWGRASAAIIDADSDALRAAMNTVEEFLTEPTAIDIEGSLLSDWVAAGHSANSFPGQRAWNIQEREPWEIARYVMSLLKDEDHVPTSTWREVVEAVSVTELGHEMARLGGCTDSQKINDLVAQGMDVWTARFAYAPQLGAEPMRRFSWEFGAYSLSINLASRDATFTSNSHKFNRVSRTGALPTVSKMHEILSNRDVIGVGLQTSQANLALELRATATEAVADQIFTHLNVEERGTGFQAAQVKTMEVRIPSADTTAWIEFDRSVIKVPTPLPLKTFVMLVAKFVVGLPPDEMSELQEKLGLDD